MNKENIVYVRFPNTSYHEEVVNFDWEKFTPTNEFDDEIFGKYANMTIAIKKQTNADSYKLDETPIKDC